MFNVLIPFSSRVVGGGRGGGLSVSGVGIEFYPPSPLPCPITSIKKTQKLGQSKHVAGTFSSSYTFCERCIYPPHLSASLTKYICTSIFPKQVLHFHLCCRSLIKVKFSTDQFRPALGSRGCRLWLCSKTLKTALFQTFSTWHPNTFCPYCLILT